MIYLYFVFFFSSRRRHTRFDCDWSSDVCSSDLHADDRHALRPHALSGRGRRQPGRARHARRARPLHVSRRRLCRAVLDGAPRRASPEAPALGSRRDEREGRALRQGAPDDQRAPRRSERSPQRSLLPAGGRARGARPRPQGSLRARGRGARAPALPPPPRHGPRPLRRRVAVRARDPPSRMADAARVRLASPDRARDARGARRPPGSPPGRDPHQDPPAHGARAARPLGAHRLVGRGARRRRGALEAADRALTSLLRSRGSERQGMFETPTLLHMEETMERTFGEPQPWMPSAPPPPPMAPSPGPRMPAAPSPGPRMPAPAAPKPAAKAARPKAQPKRKAEAKAAARRKHKGKAKARKAK